MNTLILFLLSFSFMSYSFEKPNYSVMQFCQDMNVVLHRISLHSLNIANVSTTRSVSGGYYRRQLIESCKHGHCKVVESTEPPVMRHDPGHPDANTNGYVAYPPFSASVEMSEMIKVQKVKDVLMENMPVPSIHLLQGQAFKKCLNEYPFFKDSFDYQSYLGR